MAPATDKGREQTAATIELEVATRVALKAEDICQYFPVGEHVERRGVLGHTNTRGPKAHAVR